MIIMVTGVARAGKSMVMQMLQAGGVELAYDAKYLGPSKFNENGFFEWPDVGDKMCDPDFRANLEGKAVNVVTHETNVIPFGCRKGIKVIWIQRPKEKTYQSHARVIREGIIQMGLEVDPGPYYHMIEGQINRLTREINSYNNHMILQYDEVLAEPRTTAMKLAVFTELPGFDIEAAADTPTARLCHF